MKIYEIYFPQDNIDAILNKLNKISRKNTIEFN